MVTQPTDFAIIQQALTTYGKASGATLNPHKSRALPIANWSVPATELRIAFRTDVKILGISFGGTIQQSINNSWKSKIQAVRAIARKSFHRSLCLAQRIQYVRMYLFAKIWYVAQTFPPKITQIKQLEALAAWFIWHGATFWVPLSKLQREKMKVDGEWKLSRSNSECSSALE
jgi:hypothetical protein